MLEKLKEITIEIVTTRFLNSCLVWRGEGKKRKERKRWRVFGTLQVGNKMVSCEPNHNTVAFDEQNQYKLFPRVIQLRLRSCQNASAK